VGLGRERVRALGLGTAGSAVRTPQKVPGLAGVTQLAAGLEESMALRSDGTLLVWGWENFGLRGDGIPRFSNLPVPTPVTAVSGVTRIAMAGNTVLVLASAVIMPDVVGELGASALGQLHALRLSARELSVPDPDRRCPPRRTGGVAEPAARLCRAAGPARVDPGLCPGIERLFLTAAHQPGRANRRPAQRLTHDGSSMPACLATESRTRPAPPTDHPGRCPGYRTVTTCTPQPGSMRRARRRRSLAVIAGM